MPVYNSIYNGICTLKSPLFWIVVGIIFFQYKRIGEMGKKTLGMMKISPVENTLRSIIIGMLGGILAGVVFSHLNIIINPKDFYFILPLAIILSLIHPRFICFAYSGGIVSILSLVFGYPNVNVSGIMMMVGVLHLVESLLILIDGAVGKIPFFMEKGGNIIGGFTMNRFWPVPFTVPVNRGHIFPITIIAILGYGDFALTNYPETKVKETSRILFLFSIILILFAKLSNQHHIFGYAAAIFAPFGHELTIGIGRIREKGGNYIFTPSDKGLKILDVLPNGIGERMGFEPGDIILSINDNRINNKEDIENILYYRPKFIWVDVLDREKGLITKEYKELKKGIVNLGIMVVTSYPRYTFMMKRPKNPIGELIKRLNKKKATSKIK